MNFFEDQAIDHAVYDFFAGERPIQVARAPGRLDIMGGNVDFTGGMVLQGLLHESVWVAVQLRSDRCICIFNPGAAQFGWDSSFEISSSDLRDVATIRLLCTQRETSHWIAYVLGSLYYLKRFHGCLTEGGISLFIASNLPPNKGVSSSAALEVATLKAVSAACGLSLEGITLATAGQWVENVVVGAACGIMDQAAIVLGKKNQLLPLLCQPCKPFPLVQLPEGIRFWGIDSMAPRATAGTLYERARAAAFMGYKLICRYQAIDPLPDHTSQIQRWTDSRWNGYLSNLPLSEFRSIYERWLPEFLSGHDFLSQAGDHIDAFTTVSPDLDYPIRAAVRYAVEENLRVQTVSTLLQCPLSDASLQLIGEILRQSHVAYSECGLGSDACDELVALAFEEGLPGAKMTGGGAGGVVAILGRSDSEPAIQNIVRKYAEKKGAIPHIFAGSSDGVDATGISTFQLPLQEKQ